MRRVPLLYAAAGLVVGALAATHLTSRAQGPARPAGGSASAAAPEAGPQRSVQDALVRPFRFAFKTPISLAELATRLGQELGAPVALDLAALERLDVKPEDTVALELEGVRLKTGLKLLLDQAGLTYRVVPEDNLLILTDQEGSQDPVERLSAEVRELHRDIHDVQDAVDELRELLSPTGGEGARVRKPTIIEELPEACEPRPDDKAQEPGLKPDPRVQPDGERPGGPMPRRRTRL